MIALTCPNPSATAARDLLQLHLNARSHASSALSVQGIDVPDRLEGDDDVLALAALAVAQTFGLLQGAREQRVRALVRAALGGAADGALERCAPDAVLLWAAAMSEWCERNGLDHEFSRLQPRASVADADPRSSPLGRIHWRIAAAWHQESFGRRDEVASLLEQAEAIAARSGQVELQVAVWLHQARLAVARVAPLRALALARRVADHADERTSPLWLADANDVMARAALMQGDWHQALHRSRSAAARAELARATPSYALTYRLCESYALLGMGAYDEALSLTKTLAAIPQPVFLTHRLKLLARLFALVRDDRHGRWSPRSQRALAAVIRQLRELDWPGVLALLPRVVARIWARALDAGIETDWVSASIRSRDLLPSEPSWPRSWPWSVRVAVLGPFSCEVEGRVIGTGAPGKAAAKPLALLRRLAAEGGHDSVPAEMLGQALWPGQARQGRDKALETTLARLRRILGRHDAVLVGDRRLQLNADRVWLDTAAIDRHFKQLQERSRGGDPTSDRSQNWDASLALWRGPLLADEPSSPWVEALRERARRRMAAALHEDAGFPGHHARRLRAIAADPDLERFL